MPSPDEKVVREVLSRHDRDISCRNAVDNAWTAVTEKYPERSWWRRKSTTRGLVWEYSVNNAVAAFDGAPGVAIIPEKDTRSFVFDDTVLVRFKKANTQLLSSNYPTLSALLFHLHKPDLFGFDGHHRVEIVHAFNQWETALDWVGVVAREGKKVLWKFELRAGGAAVEPLPRPTTRPPAADTVLRPAKPDADKTSDSDSE